MTDQASVYVVLLNWNGWRDTIACLQSLLQSREVQLRVIVCDNASGVACSKGNNSMPSPDKLPMASRVRSPSETFRQ